MYTPQQQHMPRLFCSAYPKREMTRPQPPAHVPLPLSPLPRCLFLSRFRSLPRFLLPSGSTMIMTRWDASRRNNDSRVKGIQSSDIRNAKNKIVKIRADGAIRPPKNEKRSSVLPFYLLLFTNMCSPTLHAAIHHPRQTRGGGG